MATNPSPATTETARPASLRMVLYGLVFCLLIILCGLVVRDSRAQRQAKPFPTGGDATIYEHGRR